MVDLDGRRAFDLTGSYGVNVFGHEFYKSCMAEAAARVRDLGAVLGPLHPCACWNADRLCRISGKDEVSFHMSGTEAVMQAVRLARYHTGRHQVVRFCGAYHGWWDDVQPGPGNPGTPRDTLSQASALHADETGVRCTGKTHWLHVASTATHSFFSHSPKRGTEGFSAAGILPGYQGILVHDFWGAYDQLSCDHSRCNAHLLREFVRLLARMG